ncbi:NAD(P)H-dependent oxidoreductase subunit E, partial [bacterium]
MPDILENIPENDPLHNPAQKVIIDRILADNHDRQGATMVVLNELQKQIGFVSEAMQAYVARELKVPVSSVHGVVSFYSFFTTS